MNSLIPHLFTYQFRKIAWGISAILVCLLAALTARSQVNAAFTVSSVEGCAPLLVEFKNTSTGTTAETNFEWKLGNGNTSYTRDAAAIYASAGEYTVVLSITENGITATKQAQILVHASPRVNFSVDTTIGCAPLNVTFRLEPGQRENTSAYAYFWDFGDGTVVENTSENVFEHQYTFGQYHSVSLVTTNQWGCQTKIRKDSLVHSYRPLLVDFTSPDSTICAIGQEVRLQNKTSGEGTLNYKWELGDGTVSTALNPVHTFAVKGFYDVTLTVSNEIGCVKTIKKPRYINAANFQPSLEIDQPLCTESFNYFRNRSFPMPANTHWDIPSLGSGMDLEDSVTNFIFNTSGSYTIRMINEYTAACKDTLFKTFFVNKVPEVGEIVIEKSSECGAPVDVLLKDTSKEAIQWDWRIGWAGGDHVWASGQSHSFRQTQNNEIPIYLKASAATGCFRERWGTVRVLDPTANIIVLDQNSQDPDYLHGCVGITYRFMAIASQEIASYKWTFHDKGTVLTDSRPSYQFNIPGHHKVTLEYTTVEGCTGTLDYDHVMISPKPMYDINAISGQEICGNTPVQLQATTPKDPFSWEIDFGDGTPRIGYWSQNSNTHTVTHKYTKEGTYDVTISLIHDNCWDTVFLKNYYTVRPIFPSIHKIENTCDDTRGKVLFTDSSKQVESWSWDFGDGNTSATYNSYQPTIQHRYDKTGTYMAVLTTTNGSCTVKDSIQVDVLLKQNPRFTLDREEMCAYGDGFVYQRIDNLERNPKEYHVSYDVWKMELENGERVGMNGGGDYEKPHINMWSTFDNQHRGLLKFRAITQSYYFGCLDTSNFVSIKVNGPVAYPFRLTDACTTDKIWFSDSSKTFENVPIVSWLWNMPDYMERKTGGPFSFTPAYIPSSGHLDGYLEVTDANGCKSSQSFYYTDLYQLKADFTADQTVLEPGQTVNFNNLTVHNEYKTIQYRWFVNGRPISTEWNSSYTFNDPGTYSIMLIASFTDLSCADTIQKRVLVRNQNAVFQTRTSYVKNSGCPPVVVSFTTQVEGNAAITWDFGDNSRSENSFSPTHTYHQPGTYFIKMKAVFPNGQTIEGLDSITITGSPPVSLDADKWSGCTNQSVTLSSGAQGLLYAWDFGDGTIITNNTLSANHNYSKAGIFTPSLLLIDSMGCRQLGEARQPIIIDSLSISFASSQNRFCENAEVQITPRITSVAEQAGLPLAYQWDLGPGALTRYSSDRNVVATYSSVGIHTIRLAVNSPLGCQKTISTTITIDALKTSAINATDAACTGEVIQVSPSPIDNNLTYKWNFSNGQTANESTPAGIKFSPGNYLIQLYTINNSCIDTAEKYITINPAPTIRISNKELTVCVGESVQLEASGAARYNWFPAEGLSNAAIANPVASPGRSEVYTVTGTSALGCSATNEVRVTAIPDYTVEITPDTAICLGSIVPIQVTGGLTYQWIGSTAGLSSTTSSRPMAQPLESTQYRVQTTAASGCFPKETVINIQVYPLPEVSLGPDLLTSGATPLTLSAQTSTDVTKWTWSPNNYLSCNNCPQPISTPLKSIIYTLEVRNENGCSATDEIQLTVGCDENKIFIPNAFTPNGDGKNDRFQLQAAGINEIEGFQIFNRFGQLVYEVKHIDPAATAAAWDGRMNGTLQPAGTYVYFIQLRCFNNQQIVRKGSVVLIH